MKIAIVGINYTPELTGISLYTTGLADGLRARGHDVRVVTGLPHYPEWRVHDDYRARGSGDETIGDVPVRRLRHYVPEQHPTARTRIRMEASFAGAVARESLADADVVVAVSPTLLSSAAVVAKARARRIPVGVIVQDLYGKGARETGAVGGRLAAVLAEVESRLLRSATGVAVIHDQFVETLTAAGVPRDRLKVIRNWTHIGEALGPGADVADVRARRGWGDDDLVVLHAGNMGAKQGLENVVAAARLAGDRTDGRTVRFVLLGDGNQRRALEAEAAGTPALEFIPPLPDEEFLNTLVAADVLLVNEKPGVGEMAVPSKLTTYFKIGKPVVAATDELSGAASEVRASGAGVVVPPGDPKSLLDSIFEVTADRTRMDRFAVAGQRYCREVLDRDAAISKYEEWCSELVARSGGGAQL